MNKRNYMLDLVKSSRAIKYIVIHCTATNPIYNFSVKDIASWHKLRGWNEVGYNYIIRLDGTIELGRHVHKIPAHVHRQNKNSIGIVYVGGINNNNNAADTRTLHQRIELEFLLQRLRILYPNAKILGHRDFPNIAKACPCFDAQSEYAHI
jgi:N-acetylmuramoyl-L-alanine amidase